MYKTVDVLLTKVYCVKILFFVGFRLEPTRLCMIRKDDTNKKPQTYLENIYLPPLNVLFLICELSLKD